MGAVPYDLVLSLALALTFLFTWRALVTERRRRARLGFLYDATHALSLSSSVESGLLDVVALCRTAFGAGVVEVILLSRGRTMPPARVRVSTDGVEANHALDVESTWTFQELAAAEGEPVCVVAPRRTEGLNAYFAASGLSGPAMIARLPGGSGTLGFILVGDRSAEEGRFSGADRELLAKLAGTVAAWLAHDSLEQDFGRLERLQVQLEHTAFHDSLTGLPNRSRFRQCVTDALARRDGLVAALFVDLDDFKTVNDSMGHRAGDELLTAVGERLRGCLRTRDTAARLGGDEFAVLVDGAESIDGVLEIAGRVLTALDAPIALADGEVRVRASVGVASSGATVRLADDLLRNADLAMYRAKARGKGCVVLYEAEMHATVVERHALKSELEAAIGAEQLVVLYQPVVDLATGHIAEVEALVRWRHPRLGLKTPDTFIALAEEAGLISDVGRSVLAAACDRLGRWQEASIAGEAFGLSVNLSDREFQHPNLVVLLTETVARAGVPASAVTLELTESAILADVLAGAARLHALRAAGFRLALDDFGLGVSNLGSLRALPIDLLKLPKPFVDHIVERPEDLAFLGAILDLARSLSLGVVVKGVETATQARALLELGVPRVQGFVFSRPVEAHALSALLTVAPLRGFASAPEGAPEPDLLRAVVPG